ncbi:Prolyl 4-hydroxylase, alpha polypeptide, partial [Ilyodon furcidens]
LARATVRDPKTGVLTTANYRVSKSAWLEGEEDPVIDRVNQRIEDITGLTVQTAELLQVANYGVGGQYEPHFDFSRKEEPDAFKRLGTGNRLATILNYVSTSIQSPLIIDQLWKPHLSNYGFYRKVTMAAIHLCCMCSSTMV